MDSFTRWLAAQGVTLPDRAEAIEAAIAGGLVLACLTLGVFAGRTLGPRLAALWRKHVAHHGEGLWERMAVIVRHGAAALLLAIVFAAYPWSWLAGLPIGIALGAATALLAVQLLRALGIPRWSARLVALALFVASFSKAIGGLAPITAMLDRIGFDVGDTRFSLLALVTILITIVVLIAIVRLANRVIAHWITRDSRFDPTQQVLAQKLAGIAIIVVAFFVALDLLNIDLTAFAVFGGAMGLAVGFGLQKTVGNLIAGIILLMDRSIKPGDVIAVGDSFGWVNKIGVRAVSVITRDGKEHLIPNENLMTQEVENWSYSDLNVRVRIKVGVGYDCDLKLAQDLMLRAARESKRVLDSPEPAVRLNAFGDNAVEHEIRVWISDPSGGVGNVRSEVLNRLWWLFKEHDISIPFPQREVTIRQAAERPSPNAGEHSTEGEHARS